MNMLKKWYLYIFLLAVIIGSFLYFKRACFGYQCQYNVMDELIFRVSRFDNFDKNQILDKAKENKIILLDVREELEYQVGHIPGSTNLPLSLLSQNLNPNLPKDLPIYIYCRSGNRSIEAKRILTNLGYNNLIDLGGIIEWEQSGGLITQ